MTKKYLSDVISKFFIQLRNSSEKEGYPRLRFGLKKLYIDKEQKERWAALCEWSIPNPGSVEKAEDELSQVCPDEGLIRAYWKKEGFPDKQSRNLFVACESYVSSLCTFTDTFRRSLEK